MSYNFKKVDRNKPDIKKKFEERIEKDSAYTIQFVDWLWTDEEFEQLLNTTFMDFEFSPSRYGYYFLRQK